MAGSTEALSTPSRASRLLSALLKGKEKTAARLLAGIFKKHWRIVSIVLSLQVLATLFESSTIGILLLALKALSGEPIGGSMTGVSSLDSLLGKLAQTFATETLFLVLVCAAVAAQLAVSVLNFSSRATAARLQANVEGDLRSRIFRRLMSMSYGQVMRYKIGELASYNEQVNYVGHVIQLLNLISSQLFMMAAYVVLLFLLSWQMSLAALLAVLVLSLSLNHVIRRIRDLGSRFTAAGVALTARTVEFLGGIRLIRTFGREDYAIDQVEGAIFDSVGFRRRSLTWHAAIGPLADGFAVLGVAVLLVGGYLLLHDHLTGALPRIIAFLFVLYRLLPRVKGVGERIGHINAYWDFVRRVGTILSTETSEARRQGNRRFAGLARDIEFKGVGLRYEDGGEWAVRNLTCTISKNSIVGLVGESGAGKSTVADLLLGLYPPSEGSLRVDGVDVRDLDWDSWRDHIAAVTQDAFIFHSSIRANIAFGRLDATEEQIVAAAQEADAHEFITRLQDGYDSLVGDQGYRLSAGQRQRLGLARALLRDPEILVLDEATSNLDSASERRIMNAIARERGRRTIIIIAHRLSTMTDADRILVLDRGRLVEDGSHEELLAAGGRYARLWELQSERPSGS